MRVISLNTFWSYEGNALIIGNKEEKLAIIIITYDTFAMAIVENETITIFKMLVYIVLF